MAQEGAERGELGLVMSGGGARAAYQVGFLAAVAERFPDLRVDILTGVSAGAINAALLASKPGDFRARVDELVELWSELRAEDVLRVGGTSLAWRVLRWGTRLASGGLVRPRHLQGLVDTTPLRGLLGRALGSSDGSLPGIARRIDEGSLKACAMTATSYSSGCSVTFVQGRDIIDWERPKRISRQRRLTVDHVMASAALPMLFPAVRLEDGWYGDGGVRLTAPLSPAIHLGAQRILAISTRFDRPGTQCAPPAPPAVPLSEDGYPPPAQVAGVLLNAIFLDLLDADALRLERFNTLLHRLPPAERPDLRPISLLVCRPSRDLGVLANEFEARLPRALRFLARGTGTQETRSNDFLSLIMFQPDYCARLLEIGLVDGRAQCEAIGAFLEGDARPARAGRSSG